jgi:hypothetical protein
MLKSYTWILQRKRRQDESPPRPPSETQGQEGRRSRAREDLETRRFKDRDRIDSNIRNTTVTGRGYEETMRTIREYTDQERDRDRNQDRERDRDRPKETKKYCRT